MRVVTRGDMDGLVGAVIVSLHETVDGIELLHPQDLATGGAEIRADDIIINLPYHPDCAMWFDHHQHTSRRAEPPKDFKGAYGLAPSAARLVYNYYGGAETMPDLADLVRETDRVDSADLKPGDVISPHGWVQIGFTIDGRTGLGAFRDYFMTLFDLLRRAPTVEEVLAHPAVAERCAAMARQQVAFREALETCSTVRENVVVTDFRQLAKVPVGNRFLVYAVFPEVNVSLRLHWGPKKESVVAVVGHSIFNRTCRTNVGKLAARFGGGGHRGAGSIPLDPTTADFDVEAIIRELVTGG